MLAGDFNVDRGRVDARCATLAGEEWGFSPAGPGHRPHPRSRRGRRRRFARWPDERRARDGRLLSDHAPVEVDIDMNWPEQRARFPVLERLAYLNAGTFGPLARDDLAAMAELRAWEGEHGRGGKPYFEAMLARRDRVRELFAGADPRAGRARRAHGLDDPGRARSSSAGSASARATRS